MAKNRRRTLKHREMRDYIEKRFKKIDVRFKSCIDGYSPENIHLFRVEVKKLRAFLRLIRTVISHPDKLKLSERFKKIYKTAGNIRLLQVQLREVDRKIKQMAGIIPESYKSFLSAEAAAGMILLTDLLTNSRSFKKERKDILHRLPPKLRHRSIKKFVLLKKSNLLACLTEEPIKDESLHSVRKILKDFQYCWQYIQADVQTLLPAGLAAKDKIKETTDRIGRFHDTAVALNLLGENRREGIVSDDEMGSLLNIRKEWQDNKEALRRQVSSQLESCFK